MTEKADLFKFTGFSPVNEREAAGMAPAVLAYIGDSVYELCVRLYISSSSVNSVKKLHEKAVRFVNAPAQADLLKKIINKLSDEERDIVRRGRNVKSGRVPKNADVLEYRYATGLEALMGYLYISGRHARLREVFTDIVESNQDMTK